MYAHVACNDRPVEDVDEEVHQWHMLCGTWHIRRAPEPIVRPSAIGDVMVAMDPMTLMMFPMVKLRPNEVRHYSYCRLRPSIVVDCLLPTCCPIVAVVAVQLR